MNIPYNRLLSYLALMKLDADCACYSNAIADVIEYVEDNYDY